jgi:putative tricarboxylic transport membrane protein
MSDQQDGRAAFRTRSAEIAVALIFLALGAIVIYDSARIGARWGDDGPQTGYFPFYIGVFICVSSAIVLLQAALMKPERNKTFVEVEQLKLVLTVLVPSIVYVALIGGAGPVPGLGIYVASAIFVAFFMRWLGKYPWWKVAAVSLGNSVAFFLIFEVWFKIPLPKGPLESLLGLN